MNDLNDIRARFESGLCTREDMSRLFELIAQLTAQIDQAGQAMQRIKAAAVLAEAGTTQRFAADTQTMRESIERLQARLREHDLDAS